MLRKLLWSLLGLSAAAAAQDPSRDDYCTADPLAKRVADATAFLVPLSLLQQNPGTGTYRLETGLHTYFVTTGAAPALCPDQPYYNQIVALRGRTGALIGPRTILTAAHAPTGTGEGLFDPKNYAVIFNWRWVDDGTQPQDSPDHNCKLDLDPEAIPQARIYFADPASDPPGSPYNTKDTVGNPADFMIFQLDRPVAGVTPLPLRRSGDALLGDPVIAPGYQHYLPLKIANGGHIMRTGPNGIAIGELPLAGGSSGSPVFNIRSQLVESVVARARGSVGEMQLDPVAGCYREVRSLFSFGALTNDVNNLSTKILPPAQLPATTALQVAPLNAVRHTVIGASVSNQTSSFDVTLPSIASGPVTYRVRASDMPKFMDSPPSVVSAGLTLTPPAGDYTIQPGETQRFTAEVTSLPNDCDVFDAEVRVTPQTAGAFSSIIPHRFEALRRDFSVTPDTAWAFTQFAPPYPTRVLTLRNPTAITTTVVANSSASWLLVNNASSVAFTLAPIGTAGDTATATLSIASGADLMVPPGTTGKARVTVNASNMRCVERGPEEIDVAFTNGVLDLSASDSSGLPLPPPTGGNVYGTAREFTFDLSAYAGEIIADINASASFDTTSAGALPQAQVPASIAFEIQTPNAIPAGNPPHVFKIWDGNAASTSYWSAESGGYYRLRLDDEVTPPLAGTLLSVADGENMGGIWKLRLFNRSSGQIYPNDVKLRIVRTP